MEIKKQLSKAVFFLVLFIFPFGAVETLLSQSFYSKDNYTGLWETPETWIPQWSKPVTNKITQNITIKGFVKRTGDLKFKDGSLTVQDTLVVDGYLQLGEDTKITLKKNAVLIVQGSVMVKDDDGRIKVGEGAYFVVGGKFMVQNGGDLDEFSSLDNPPKIFIGGKIEPPNIANDDSDYASLDCKNPNHPYPHSGCTFGNFEDFKNDPFYSFYKSLKNSDTPIITEEPLDVDACSGSDVEFTIEADNAVNFQWQVDDGSGFVDLVDNLLFVGSQSNQLTINNTTNAINGYLFRCRVSDINDNFLFSEPASLTLIPAVKAKVGAKKVSICENSFHKVSGATVSNGNGVLLWTHNGQGSLSDATTLSPTYSPVATDRGNEVVLTLTAQGNVGCPPDTDQMTIDVTKQVSANAGTNVTICENSFYRITDASVANGNGNFNWSLNGTGKGTLTERNTLKPTYTANPLDADKIVTLTLKAEGLEDCLAVESSMTITVAKQVAAYAGKSVSICANSPYKVVDATVESGNGIFSWSNDGMGTLTDDDTLSPTYTPSPLDVGQTVTLTLTASGNVDCSSVTSEMEITVLEQVNVLNVGNDTTICENLSLKVLSANVENNGTLSWTHDGSGELLDDDTLSPTYVTHASDAGKTVVLTITAEGQAEGCLPATGEMKITVEPQVTVNAGEHVSICENETYKVVGAEVEHGNGTFTWTHDGNGTLLDDNTLSPTYSPDAQDAGQVVTLTLSAPGNADCTSASDEATIKIDKQVYGSIGPDDSICGTSYILSGSGSGGTGIWSQANGPGQSQFAPRNDLETPEVSVTTPGEYIFNWTYSNGQCIDESSVTVHFKEIPNAEIESETSVCGLEQMVSASPNKGTGFWEITSGPDGAVFDKNINNGINKIKVEEVGVYALSWIANLDGCMDTAHQVIRFNKVPKVNPGPDREVFYSREVVLDASLENDETGFWEIESGYGLFENKHLMNTKVTDLQIGENIFEWVVSNGLCESSNTVSIIVNDAQIPNIITPNGDGKNDFFIIKDIENFDPVHLVIFNRWGNRVYESNNYTNQWDGRDTNGKELMNDTYYYYVEFSNKKVIKGYVLIQR